MDIKAFASSVCVVDYNTFLYLIFLKTVYVTMKSFLITINMLKPILKKSLLKNNATLDSM